MPAGRSSLPCHGGNRHGGAAVRLRRTRRAGWRLCLRHDPRPPAQADDRCTGVDGRASWLRLERRIDSPARLAAARPSGSAEPRLGADERSHDQGGDLRLRAYRLRPARAARLVVGAAAHRAGRDDGRPGAAVRGARPRPQARAGLFDDRECRLDLRGAGPRSGLPRQRPARGGGRRDGRRTPARPQPFLVQVPAVPRRGRHPARHRSARPRWAGRPHPSHAAHRCFLSGGCARHFRLAAAQRLRLRVAAVPGRHCRARPAAGGAAFCLPGHRRHAGAGRRARGRLFRARLRHGLPRPSAQRRSGRRARCAACPAGRHGWARLPVHPGRAHGQRAGHGTGAGAGQARGRRAARARQRSHARSR